MLAACGGRLDLIIPQPQLEGVGETTVMGGTGLNRAALRYART